MTNALPDADHDLRIQLERDNYLSHRNSSRPNDPSRTVFSPEQQRLIYHTHMETVDTLEVYDRLLPNMGSTRSRVTRPIVQALVRRIMNECRSLQSLPEKQAHWDSVKNAPEEWPDHIRVQARDSLLKFVRHADEPNRDQFDIRCSKTDDSGQKQDFIWFHRDHQAFICHAILQESLTWETTALALGNCYSRHFRNSLKACFISRVYRYIALQFQESHPRSPEAHHWGSFRHRDENLLAEIRHHLPFEVQRMPLRPLLQSTGPSPFSPRDTTGQTLQPSQKRRAAHTLDSESSGSRASSSSLEPKKDEALERLARHHSVETQETFDEAKKQGGDGEALVAISKLIQRQESDKKVVREAWNTQIEAKDLRRQERQEKQRRAQKPSSQGVQHGYQSSIPERTAESRHPSYPSQAPYSQGGQHGYQSSVPQRTAGSGTSGYPPQDPYSQGGQYGYQSSVPQRTAGSGTSGYPPQDPYSQGGQYDDREREDMRQRAAATEFELANFARESEQMMASRAPQIREAPREEVPQNRPQDKTGRPRRKKPSRH